jgi:hypothetical protein
MFFLGTGDVQMVNAFNFCWVTYYWHHCDWLVTEALVRRGWEA